MKKEENFHIIQLICDEALNGEESMEDIFNPQVLFVTSGAANASTDNLNIYGVIRSEGTSIVRRLCSGTRSCW